MNTLSVRHIGNIFRVLLLLISLLAAGTVVVYHSYPSLLHRLDRILINAHLAPYENRLTQARQALTTGDSEAITILEALLGDLKWVRHMDRLKHIKRQAFIWVVDALMTADNPERALYWADQWTAYDGKDLEGQAAQAHIWYQSDATRQKGLQQILSLYRMTPEVDFIAKIYVEAMIDQGDGLSALEAVLKHIEDCRTVSLPGWGVSYSTGGRVSHRDKHNVMPVISEDGTMTLSFGIPPGTRMIRVDPPPGLDLMVVKPQVRYMACDQTSSKYLVDTALKLNEMTLVHDSLVSMGGNDPFFYWPLAGDRKPYCQVVEVRARIDQPYPSWLDPQGSMAADMIVKDMGTDPEARRVLALFSVLRLDLIRRSEGAKRLTVEHRGKQLKILKAMADELMKIYWKKGTLGFAESRTSSAPLKARLAGDKIVFDTVLPIGSAIDQIRLDFPEINGAVFRIKDAETTGPKGSRAIQFKKTVLSQAHNLEILEDTFMVMGKDPYVSISIDGNEAPVSALQLRGVIR